MGGAVRNKTAEMPRGTTEGPGSLTDIRYQYQGDLDLPPQLQGMNQACGNDAVKIAAHSSEVPKLGSGDSSADTVFLLCPQDAWPWEQMICFEKHLVTPSPT